MRHVIEFFEGFVEEIDKDTFWVRITNEDEDWEAEIYLSKISSEEQKYLTIGADFSWAMYNDETYDFIFSKEVWTEEQIQQFRKDAEVLWSKSKEKKILDELFDKANHVDPNNYIEKLNKND